jgi:capsular polysaccharide transport system permease protein
MGGVTPARYPAAILARLHGQWHCLNGLLDRTARKLGAHGTYIDAGDMKLEIPFPAETATAVKKPVALSWLKKRLWFVVFVIFPTLLATIYYAFIASDMYVSESRFVIKVPDSRHQQMSTLANLIQTTGLSGGQEQTNEILEYVRSRDALKELERRLHIRNHYENRGDALSKYPFPMSGDSFEKFYKYYRKIVEASLDPQTGTAVIKVKSFTPDEAYKINQTLLDLSEGLVNRLNQRAESRAISEAQSQVDIASARAKRVSLLLTQYRNHSELIDPAKQAVGVLDISNGMVAQRAALVAQLEVMQREAPQNPSIPALRNKISAMSGQIAVQDNRVVGGNGAIASKLGNYENLQVEQKFATDSLDAANAGLVQARAEAQRQKFYLEHIVDPNTPDTALLPTRLTDIITIAAAALCLYFIGWMLIVGILEHAPED